MICPLAVVAKKLRRWRQGFGFGGLLFVPGREIKQPPLDKWIDTACEVAEQIGPLNVKLIFKHGSPNNPGALALSSN
jgi:hypothetical protein